MAWLRLWLLLAHIIYQTCCFHTIPMLYHGLMQPNSLPSSFYGSNRLCESSAIYERKRGILPLRLHAKKSSYSHHNTKTLQLADKSNVAKPSHNKKLMRHLDDVDDEDEEEEDDDYGYEEEEDDNNDDDDDETSDGFGEGDDDDDEGFGNKESSYLNKKLYDARNKEKLQNQKDKLDSREKKLSKRSRGAKILKEPCEPSVNRTRVQISSSRIDSNLVPKENRFSLSVLTPGQQLRGKIVTHFEYGMYIDVGAERDGIVYVKDMSKHYYLKSEFPNMYPLGSIIDCYVKFIDIKEHKLALTLFTDCHHFVTTQDSRKLQIGDEVQGEVIRVCRYGVYLDIGVGCEAFLPKRKMKITWIQRKMNPWEIHPLGSKIKCYLYKNSYGRRIELATYPVEEWEFQFSSSPSYQRDFLAERLTPPPAAVVGRREQYPSFSAVSSLPKQRQSISYDNDDYDRIFNAGGEDDEDDSEEEEGEGEGEEDDSSNMTNSFSQDEMSKYMTDYIATRERNLLNEDEMKVLSYKEETEAVILYKSLKGKSGQLKLAHILKWPPVLVKLRENGITLDQLKVIYTQARDNIAGKYLNPFQFREFIKLFNIYCQSSSPASSGSSSSSLVRQDHLNKHHIVMDELIPGEIPYIPDTPVGVSLSNNGNTKPLPDYIVSEGEETIDKDGGVVRVEGFVISLKSDQSKAKIDVREDMLVPYNQEQKTLKEVFSLLGKGRVHVSVAELLRWDAIYNFIQKRYITVEDLHGWCNQFGHYKGFAMDGFKKLVGKLYEKYEEHQILAQSQTTEENAD